MVRLRRSRVPLACLCLGLAAATAGAAVTGRVFEDRNASGSHEPGEPGIPGVLVSNGLDVTLTGPGGKYSLPERPGAFVFVVKPRGYRPLSDTFELPRFHSARAPKTADFPLVRAVEPDTLRFLVLTDTQPASTSEIGYLARGLVARIPTGAGFAFGVTLGDIVYDRPDLFAPVNAVIAATRVPWYNLPGNHDLALGSADEGAAVAPFESVYGPSTYAFHAGPGLFIALDDVRPQGGPRYIGGFTRDQFSFLENLLRATNPSEWTVLLFHIPIFSPDPSGMETFRTADRLRLFALLKDRPNVVILSGHTHYQRHVIHGPADGRQGKPIHEYNVAAACGGFWGGPRDAEGIPAATMWDGTPPGYAIGSFTDAGLSFDYVPSRLPADTQIAVHLPHVVAPRQGYVSFYANVYNGYDAWEVEARVDDRLWQPVRKVLGWDPTYAEAFLAQDSARRPLAGPRLPDPAVCYHLWRGTLPADLALGSHLLHIKATEPDGRTHEVQAPFAIAAP